MAYILYCNLSGLSYTQLLAAKLPLTTLDGYHAVDLDLGERSQRLRALAQIE